MGRLGAGARRRAQGGDLGGRRPAGRGAARSSRKRAPPSSAGGRASREERRAAARGGPAGADPRRAPSRAASPASANGLAEPRYLVAIFVVVVADRRRRRLPGHAAARRRRWQGRQAKQAAAKVAARRNRGRRVLNGTAVAGPRRQLRRQSRGQGLPARRRHQQQLELRRQRRHVRAAATSRKRSKVAQAAGDLEAAADDARKSNRLAAGADVAVSSARTMPRRRAERARAPALVFALLVLATLAAFAWAQRLKRDPLVLDQVTFVAARMHPRRRRSTASPRTATAATTGCGSASASPSPTTPPCRSSSPAAGWSSPSPATGSSSATTSSPSTGTGASAAAASPRRAATSCGSSCSARTASWCRRGRSACTGRPAGQARRKRQCGVGPGGDALSDFLAGAGRPRRGRRQRRRDPAAARPPALGWRCCSRCPLPGPDPRRPVALPPDRRPARRRPAESSPSLASRPSRSALSPYVFRRWPILLPLAIVAALPFRVPLACRRRHGQPPGPALPRHRRRSAGGCAETGRCGRRVAPQGSRERSQLCPPAGPAGGPPPGCPRCWPRVVVLYALQTLYSEDFSKGLQNVCFFFVPFTLAYRAAARRRVGPPAADAGPLAWSAIEAVVFVLVGTRRVRDPRACSGTTR